MFEDYLAQQPTAIWNTVRGVWEKLGMANLLCEHWELYSEVWPTSGMMLNGQVFELPMLAHRMEGLESLSLPLSEDFMLRTPSVTDSTGGARSEKQALERGQMVKTADQVVQLAFENGLKVSSAVEESLLPTPAVAHLRNHDEPLDDYLRRRQDFMDGKTKGMPGASLGVAVRLVEDGRDWKDALFPTPQTMDTLPARSPEQIAESKERVRAGYSNPRETVVNDLLPTPLVDDSKNTGHSDKRIKSLASETYKLGNDVLLPTPMASEGTKAPSQQTSDEKSKTGQVWLSNAAKDMETNWGKFESAIRRWEQILGRPAPAPTKPDGKDGNHRLSSLFTEWMMGLPEGWITDCGLKRNDELKACGNGVVPQQAELALRILLGDSPIVAERERERMFPTPTVSDTYTDNLKSSQQKPGSMHSVTLPQVVRMMKEEE